MPEVEFERRIEGLFAEGADFSDSEDFSDRVERRLNQAWLIQRCLIGGAGLAGGLIAVSQLMVGSLFRRVEEVGESALAVSGEFSRSVSGVEIFTALPGGFDVWVSAGLGTLILGVVLQQVIKEI